MKKCLPLILFFCLPAAASFAQVTVGNNVNSYGTPEKEAEYMGLWDTNITLGLWSMNHGKHLIRAAQLMTNCIEVNFGVLLF